MACRKVNRKMSEFYVTEFYYIIFTGDIVLEMEISVDI